MAIRTPVSRGGRRTGVPRARPWAAVRTRESPMESRDSDRVCMLKLQYHRRLGILPLMLALLCPSVGGCNNRPETVLRRTLSADVTANMRVAKSMVTRGQGGRSFFFRARTHPDVPFEKLVQLVQAGSVPLEKSPLPMGRESFPGWWNPNYLSTLEPYKVRDAGTTYLWVDRPEQRIYIEIRWD